MEGCLGIRPSERLDIDQQSLEHLVEGTHTDIRQVLNLLSTFRLTGAAMNYDQAKTLCGVPRPTILPAPRAASCDLPCSGGVNVCVCACVS